MPPLRRPAALLLALASCACSPASPSPPTEGVVFRDDFDAENRGAARADYRAFARWEVAEGSVDLLGTYPYDYLPPGSGLYVDLDGSHSRAGILRTRQALALEPGTYELSFRLGGAQRRSAPNGVVVTLGTLYRERFVVEAFAPLRTHRRLVRVARGDTARLQFAHEGGDDHGMYLDRVELRRR